MVKVTRADLQKKQLDYMLAGENNTSTGENSNARRKIEREDKNIESRTQGRSGKGKKPEGGNKNQARRQGPSKNGGKRKGKR
jgi:hypothetical protein